MYRYSMYNICGLKISRSQFECSHARCLYRLRAKTIPANKYSVDEIICCVICTPGDSISLYGLCNTNKCESNKCFLLNNYVEVNLQNFMLVQ